MKCYNSNCKEECYDYKRAACINRITEEQHLLLLAIREEDRLIGEINKLQDTILQLKESEADLSREVSYLKSKELPFTEEVRETLPRHLQEELGIL